MIYFSYIMKYCSWYMPEMPGKLARSMLESLLSLTKTGAQGLRPKAAAGTASSQSNRSPARSPGTTKQVCKDGVPGQPKTCISRATMCLSSRCLRAIALTTWRRACQEHKGLCCSQCRSWQTWSQYQAALQAHLGVLEGNLSGQFLWCRARLICGATTGTARRAPSI
jgi:hypothetical protein